MHGTEKSSKLNVTFSETTKKTVGFITVNEDGQTFHIILKVSDDGTPRLSRYKRVIVRVSP